MGKRIRRQPERSRLQEDRGARINPNQVLEYPTDARGTYIQTTSGSSAVEPVNSEDEHASVRKLLGVRRPGHNRPPPPGILNEKHPQQVPRARSRLHHNEHPPYSGYAEGSGKSHW